MRLKSLTPLVVVIAVAMSNLVWASHKDSENQAGRETTIPDGTEVRLRLLKPISSADVKAEDRIDFEAAEDVIVKGKVVIKKGSAGRGTVVEARKKRSFGRSGKLTFTIDYVKSVDDQNIRLRASREAKGDDKYGKAAVVTLLFGPFGYFVKGKNVELQAGKEFTVYIDGDRTIKLN